MVGACTSPYAGLVVCSHGNMAPGQVASININTDLDVRAVEGDFDSALSTNTTSIDSAQGNNTDTLTVTVQRQADLEVSFTTTPLPVQAGGQVTLDVTATNNGPSVASGVEITVDIPTPESTFDSYQSSTATCVFATGTLTCDAIADVLPGASVLFSLTWTIDAGVTGGTALSATASVTAVEFDPATGNNDFTANYVVVVQSDIEINLLASPSPVATIGSPIDFTVDVLNLGLSDSPSVNISCSVTDSVNVIAAPTGITAPGTCTYNSGFSILFCELGPVSLSDTPRVSWTQLVSDSATTSDTVTTTCTTISANFDPVSSNNDASLIQTLDNTADVALSVQFFPGSSATAGAAVTLSYSVINGGPSLAVNPVVTHVVPTGMSVGTLPAQCSLGGSTITCNEPTLDPLASTSGAVIFIVDSDAVGPITSAWSVSASTPDNIPGNNFASTDIPIVYSSDFGIGLGLSANPVSVGQALTFTAVITNNGFSDGDIDVSLVLQGVENGVVNFPGDCTVVLNSGTTPVQTEVDCSFTGVVSTQQILLTVDTTVDFATEGLTLVSTGQVSGGSNPDPLASNDDSTAETTVRLAAADLAISMTAAPTVFAGNNAAFSISVRNLGPDAVGSISLSNTLPANTVLVSTSFASCSQAGQVLTCNLGTLAKSGTASGSILVAVDNTYAGPLTNDASVSGGLMDPAAGNNDAMVVVTSSLRTDLAVAFVASPDPFGSGGGVDVVVLVTNNGPSYATGDVLDFALPAAGISGVTFSAGCSPSGPNNVTCSSGGGLAPGTSFSPTISFDVDASVVDGTNMLLTAYVDGNEADPQTANDRAAQTYLVEASSELAVQVCFDLLV